MVVSASLELKSRGVMHLPVNKRISGLFTVEEQAGIEAGVHADGRFDVGKLAAGAVETEYINQFWIEEFDFPGGGRVCRLLFLAERQFLHGKQVEVPDFGKDIGIVFRGVVGTCKQHGDVLDMGKGTVGDEGIGGDAAVFIGSDFIVVDAGVVGIDGSGEAAEKAEGIIFHFLELVLAQGSGGGIVEAHVEGFREVLGMEGIEYFLLALAGASVVIGNACKGFAGVEIPRLAVMLHIWAEGIRRQELAPEITFGEDIVEGRLTVVAQSGNGRQGSDRIGKLEAFNGGVDGSPQVGREILVEFPGIHHRISINLSLNERWDATQDDKGQHGFIHAGKGLCKSRQVTTKKNPGSIFMYRD